MSGLTRAMLAERDAYDPLARFRDAFVLPDGVIYLDGNSLGPLPRAALGRLETVSRHEWGEGLVRSWNRRDWINLPRRVGDKIARLIGARPGEVVVADSTSVNLFKLLAGGLRLRPGRTAIVSETGNFPTDLYVAQGLIELLDGNQELHLAPADDLVAAVDDNTAVVMLTHVDYRSGRMHDMAAITAAAHAKGALMLWDLSHSAGALPIELGACGVDFAVGCGYKYLNGGPGAPAFLYVAGRLHDAMRSPLSGWMGHADPFAFDAGYRPAEGIARQLCGTPPILSLAALDAGIELMLEADMAAVRDKSTALGEAFIALIEQQCGSFGFALASPRDPGTRGSQVALRHLQGYPITQALIGRGVIGDFRAPDILRFGFAPLYLRHVDVWDAVAALREIMATGAWDVPEFHARAAVT
ncbi:MAG: kynureninase [Alphaproteobacteria bacterium]